MKDCPFKVGDRVKFKPNEHASGWSSPSFNRLRLRPGQTGVVTRIVNGTYVYIDDERGGFHWECFSPDDEA